MRDLENDCVGCPQGCGGCGRDKSYYLWTCDECGTTTTDYYDFHHESDGKDYCSDCYCKLFEDDEEEKGE